jgi:hypothetical protein
LEDNLQQNLANSLDHCVENHLADDSADCPENHQEGNRESNSVGNLLNHSTDCLTNLLPNCRWSRLWNPDPNRQSKPPRPKWKVEMTKDKATGKWEIAKDGGGETTAKDAKSRQGSGLWTSAF